MLTLCGRRRGPAPGTGCVVLAEHLELCPLSALFCLFDSSVVCMIVCKMMCGTDHDQHTRGCNAARGGADRASRGLELSSHTRHVSADTTSHPTCGPGRRGPSRPGPAHPRFRMTIVSLSSNIAQRRSHIPPGPHAQLSRARPHRTDITSRIMPGAWMHGWKGPT